MKSTTENLLLWEQRIQERIQNRITIGEWCQKNGVSKHQYNYWNRRVREKQKADTAGMFADITPILSGAAPASPNPEPASDFQLFFKNIQVSIPGNFNPSALAGLMRVLREL